MHRYTQRPVMFLNPHQLACIRGLAAASAGLHGGLAGISFGLLRHAHAAPAVLCGVFLLTIVWMAISLAVWLGARPCPSVQMPLVLRASAPRHRWPDETLTSAADRRIQRDTSLALTNLIITDKDTP